MKRATAKSFAKLTGDYAAAAVSASSFGELDEIIAASWKFLVTPPRRSARGGASEKGF